MNEKKIGITVMIIIVIVLASFLLSNSTPSKLPQKPIVYIEEINNLPCNFFQRTGVMTPMESVIFRDYTAKKSKKWFTPYRYVYVIVNYENKDFKRVNYLNDHPQEAVDTKAIFSNKLPDLNIFDIVQKEVESPL